MKHMRFSNMGSGKVKRLTVMALCVAWLCATVSPAQAFDCEELQGAWDARVELKESGSAYSADEGYPIEANNDIYKAYIQELLLTEEGRELCLVDDPMVRILNPLYQVLHQDITVEEFSARLLEDASAIEAIWELDPIVGRDPEYMASFIDAYGATPVFLIGDLLTASITEDSDATLRLWLDLLENSDGMYAENFDTVWIYKLFRDKPDVILARIDDFKPFEERLNGSFCWMMLPEENDELAGIYGQYADDPGAGVVLEWLACEDAEQ